VTPEPNWVDSLPKYQDFLKLLARLQLLDSLRDRLDSSDVAQETMVRAVANIEQFCGSTEQELGAWLRTILVRLVIEKHRGAHTKKGDLSREQSLQRALEDSTARLEEWLADKGPSPSQNAARQEQLLELANALEKLPPRQREAVELKYFKGWKNKAIAKELDVTTAALAGLLLRGVAKIRAQLLEGEQSGNDRGSL
jgi:RNA polymerase sigma-70 factor (ECF subfamily)